MSLMKLKSFSLISLLIIFSSLTLNLNSEEKIDIWNNEKKASLSVIKSKDKTTDINTKYWK